MNTRLQQFLAAENISQGQFADSIDVARASVSHILAGRNKPGYEFISSMITHYPNLNIEWLLTGKGKMYRNQNASLPKPVQESLFRGDSLFDGFGNEEIPPQPDIEDPQQDFSVQVQAKESNNAATTSINTLSNTTKIATKQRKASKIMVFYDDGTFQEFAL